MSGRAQHPPLDLYLKREWPGTVGRSWEQWLVAVSKSWQRAVVRWGRPTQWFGRPPYGPSGWQPGPRCYPMVINFEHLGARPNFASKEFQKFFLQRISMLRKYFWIFFVKTKKVLEKIPACNGVLKIQICCGKIFKS